MPKNLLDPVDAALVAERVADGRQPNNTLAQKVGSPHRRP